MPDYSTVIIGVLAGVAIAFIIGRLLSRRGQGEREAPAAPDNSLLLLQHQISNLVKTVDQKLAESNKSITDSLRNQFGESQKLIRDITTELTQVKETGRQMINVTDQIKNLQDILKNPKQRGILGEYYLETVLKNVLPPGSYAMQYAFADGTIVDAAVFVQGKVIPIDSKFSLENYNRLVEEKDPTERARLEKLFKQDLKNRVNETSKYIKPSEGTMDFAFMFIPHEAIYYELLVSPVGGGAAGVNSRDLIEYAFNDKRVIIVSPTSFLAYLQTVLQGLKALKIEESAKEIRRRVEDLGRHLSSYASYQDRLGNALGTVVNHYNSSTQEFKKIDKDVTRITEVSPGLDAPLIDKPLKTDE